MTSQDFFNQVSVILKSPEGRAEMKRTLNQWTSEQKQQFSSAYAHYASSKLAPLLPMQIDKDNTWTSVRISNEIVFLKVEVSDAIVNETNYFSANEVRMKNHMCTTPSNALLLMTGFRVQTDYYSKDQVHLNQFQYSMADCEF
jgi:hypothetical protein